jgi:DNA repair exonuclease SbcCD ATPase subunit
MPEDVTVPGGQQTDSQQPAQDAVTWESILSELPDEHKGLYEQHVSGLKNALEGEKERRRELSERLQDATSQLEAGSEIRTQLEQLTQQLKEAERRADFVEQSMAQGVINNRLAYLAAQEVGAFDRRGNVNWQTLKEQFPELFKQPIAPRGNAGNGTGTPPSGGGPDIDAIIRARAGVR